MKYLLYIFLWVPILCLAQPKEYRTANWQDILRDKQGTIVCHWYDSEPFIYMEDGELVGVEYELMESFVNYLENKYRIQISIDWRRSPDFGTVLEEVKNSPVPVFGASAFSYTDAREKVVAYTPVYMPDISVIVTGRDVPPANSAEEFNSLFDELVAYTITGSTYERMLTDLRNEHNLNFQINYIPSNGDLIRKVVTTPNSFAYIDLPTYLMALENNQAMRRQYFYTVKLKGFGIIYPKGTDWQPAVDDYFHSEQFQADISRILYNELGAEVVSLMNQLSQSDVIGENEENMILSKEREMQSKEILEITLQSKQRQMMRNLFIGAFIFVLIITLLVYSRYKIKSKANQQLSDKQNAIKKRNRQLIDLNQEKDNLIRVVSHDIRNPVNQITGLANLIKLEGDYLSDEHRHLINQIIETGERVNQMATKILDIEALEAKKINLNMERVPSSRILTNLAKSFDESAGKKQIGIKTEIAQDLRDVWADKTYVVQCVENLISNAIKFSDPNSEILITAYNTKSWVDISVSDTGPGIPENEIPRLFKKFQRLNAKPTAGEKSIGLGLSIVKKYIHAMGGKIKVESKLGEGSTFTIRLKPYRSR